MPLGRISNVWRNRIKLMWKYAGYTATLADWLTKLRKKRGSALYQRVLQVLWYWLRYTNRKTMARTSRLYNELLKLLSQSDQWVDLGHLHTLIWMVIGLIYSGSINLTKWTSYIESRAIFAQSHQRRFSRWLHNPRLNVQRLGVAEWKVDQPGIKTRLNLK